MQEHNFNVSSLMQSLVERTTNFLESETDLEISEVQFNDRPVSSLQLSYLTSLISVNSNINMFFAFSFEKQLIFAVLQKLTEDLEYSQEEEDIYLEGSASEMLNIVAGNAAALFAPVGVKVSTSPPIIIKEAKSLSTNKQATYYASQVCTNKGMLYIYLIGPKHLFDSELNCLENGL